MKASIYIETQGCAFNVSDSEAMGGVLAQSGYEIVDSPERADLLVLNTCTVKDRTFLNFRKRLDELRRGEDGEPRPTIVAGCIPKAHKRSDLFDSVSTLGPDTIDRVSDVVRETLHGRVVHATEADRDIPSRNALPVLRRNPVIEILPIARGCLSSCTFCQTRLARGRLQSFSPEEILAQARRALDEGVREFWVTGQDTGAYGHDIDFPLPRLIGKLLDLRGDFRVRLGMTSPQWVTERLGEYLDLFEHPKMFRFFHVPVQSGSGRVLRAMKREGTVARFEAIHEAFMDRFPDSTFLTDLIAGYPTETDQDFQMTLDLVGRLGLPGTNCSRFSARPGTLAARLPGLHSSVVSERSKRLAAAVRESASRYHALRVGRNYEVLIDRIEKDGARIGRTGAYRSVKLETDAVLGETVEARIVRAGTFSLFGEIVARHAHRTVAVTT